MKNTKKLVLIGGGEIGKGNTSYETLEIDQEIVKITEKEHPNFIFIGFASSYAESYYDILKKHYQNLGCNTSQLKKKNLENNKPLAINKIRNADIIYIGGGDTILLKETINKYQLEKPLQEAYQKGCVMVGISAGAILLANSGYSDSYIIRGEDNHYRFVNGLGLININICPHYEINNEKSISLEKSLKNTKKEVIGISNNCALFFIDKKKYIITTKELANMYIINKKS